MFIAQVFTLYPEYFPGPFKNGLYGKAIEKKIWDLRTVNIRDMQLINIRQLMILLTEAAQEC